MLFEQTGGAQIGWVNATWPFAHILAEKDRLLIASRVLGNYSFTPSQVFSIERYVLLPVFAWGIRVRHQVRDYPERVIFWCFRNPEAMLEGIRSAGFVPQGSELSSPPRRGMPLRWSAIFGGIVGWNLLFMPAFIVRSHGSEPSWLYLLPLIVALGFAIAAFKSKFIQWLLLRPGRCIGEIKPFLRLLTFISSLLLLVFSVILAAGGFKE